MLSTPALIDLAEAMSGVGHCKLCLESGAVQWSDEVYRIHGVERASFDPQLGTALDFYDAAAREMIERHIARAVADRSGCAFTVKLTRRDGEVRDVTCKAVCEVAGDGEVTALVGVFQDITAHTQLLQQVSADRERYRLLTQNSTDVIATYRPDATFTYLSPAIQRLLGRTPEELVGRRTFEIIDPRDHERVAAEFAALMRAGDVARQIEYRALHADGSHVWVEAHPTPTRDERGRLIGFQDVVRDVSARKQLEIELDAARRVAEDSAQAKADFLANMSHELRTPLTGVLGYTALAAEQPELTPVTRDHLRRVQTASRALMSTVNDILDFSKLEAGQITLRESATDVLKLCNEAVELFTPQARAKGLRLEVVSDGAPLPVLLIDGDRLLQVLLNLVGNAVKFTDAGSVRVHLGEREGRLRIEVRDTGPGVAPEAMPQLFNRFSQVDGSSTRQHGGTGLGLAICRGLAERMGGGVSATSTVGQGSRFVADLPMIVALQLDQASPAVTEHASLEALRVLVVDDNESNRELARAVLAGSGVEVSQAACGLEALGILAEQPVDAVLLDLRMPDMDGCAVLTRLRSTPGPNDDVPVIAFTASDLPAGRPSGPLAGFAAMVGKPLRPEALLDAVARAIDGAVSPRTAAHG